MSEFEEWFIRKYFFDREQFDRFFKLKDGKYAPKIHTNEVYSLVFRLNFMLDVWQSRQSEIDQLTEMNQRYKGKMQEQQDQIAELKAEKDVVLKLAKQWQETARQLSITDDKHTICSLLGCAEEVEEALRGKHE